MATTTPNFGWSVPTSTDYVKDGALAIETLGDAIDASLVDLKGGASGYILSKNSASDMDFAWIPNALPATPAGINKILNGDFGIWQRGTSFTTGGVYCADRWYTVIGGTTTVSRDTDVPTDPGFNYSIKQLTAAGSSFAQWHYTFESNVVNPLRGKNVIVSYYLKANATWSGSFTANCYYSNSTDARGSQTTSVVTTVPANTPTTTWARYTATFTVPTDAVGLQIQFNPGTAQASGAALWMTGVQLEVGSVATPFSTATGNPASELAACERYYQAYGYTAAWSGYVPAAASTYFIAFPLRVTMRATPTITIVTSGDSAQMGAPTATSPSTTGVRFQSDSTGVAENRAYFDITSWNASAEL